MATGQTLLNWMEILFPELQLQTGESDVTKGLLALNAAQDAMETHIAQYDETMFGGTDGTLITTAGQEYTTFPTGLLRIDGLEMLNSQNLPSYPLSPQRREGGLQQRWWNYWATSSSTAGQPHGYFTNGLKIYWDMVPDQAYNIRYAGLVQASDITASGTFAYPDICILPLATVATKFLRTGVDDPVDNLNALAQEVFNPMLDAMSGFRRDTPLGYRYTRSHDT